MRPSVYLSVLVCLRRYGPLSLSLSRLRSAEDSDLNARILGEWRLLICPGSRKTERSVFVRGRARIYLYPRELIVLQPLTFLPRTSTTDPEPFHLRDSSSE